MRYTRFPNLAGKSRDIATETCKEELEKAGIPVTILPYYCIKNNEVQSLACGEYKGWEFEREWYYWRAKGPGIEISFAQKLWREHGTVVRISGDCTCSSPLDNFKGLACDSYHIDAQERLNALIQTIDAITNPERIRQLELYS